jgi:hypothetical protein
MKKEQLFQYLSSQDISTLLKLLGSAYDQMNIEQRRDVFGKIVLEVPPEPVDGDDLLDQIEDFFRESLSGFYYAPFDINSKNFMDVPEETEEWFEQLGDFLKASMQLTSQSNHLHATICFRKLYSLIDKLECGEEIVFGDEIGSWMIPGDEKQYLAAYLTSLAAVSSPEEFTKDAIPLLQRDSGHSLAGQVYASAKNVANDEQRAHLAAEVKRLKIRTERNW